MKSDPPRLSFVLVVGSQRERAGHALHSILRQEGIEMAEVLVLDAGADGVPPVAGSDHRVVEVLARRPASTFGQLKAEGVQRARGYLVAFLEDHCVLAPGFLKAMLDAFQGPWSAAGGKCLNANPGVGASDLMAVTNYGLWMGRMAKGEAQFVPGNNSVYRRAVLMAHEPDLVPLLTTDMVLQLRLRKDGHRFFLDPAARFGHLSEASPLSAAAAMFHYHRCMGQARAAVLG
ncbi:MAG: glycosyltransferase, partial [Anaerolineales bacterium]